MSRIAAWLRGPQIAIAIVFVVLGLDYVSYRLWERWPVVRWHMYSKKGPTEPRVQYRRFVIHRHDGTTAPSSMDEPLSFLAKAGRVEPLLAVDRAGLLLAVLRDARAADDSVIGISEEMREWAYGERTLDEHCADPPIAVYRVIELTMAPEALRKPAADSLVQNGGFDALEPRSGQPAGWELTARWFGIGVDLATGDGAALLASRNRRKPQELRQAVQLRPGQTLHLRVLVRANGEGSAVGLLGAGDAPLAQEEAPGDDAWHAVELDAVAPAEGDVTISLRGGAGDTYFDDVSLTVD